MLVTNPVFTSPRLPRSATNPKTTPKTTTAANLPTRPNFRKNGTQVVRPYGEPMTVTYVGRCPVSGVRLYDFPGAGWLENSIETFVAAEYDMTGPDFYASWLECNNSSKLTERALEMAKATWLPSAAGFGPIKAVAVRAATYFDKPNGNSYFKAEVYADGIKVLTLPRQYGQDSQIPCDAANELHKAGFIELEQYRNGSHEGPLRWAERTGATLTVHIYKASYREFYNLGNYKN